MKVVRGSMSDLLFDLHLAWRAASRNRGITVCAATILALSSCAAAVCFAFLDGAEHARVPYANADRLVHIIWDSGGVALHRPHNMVNAFVPFRVADELSRGTPTLPEVGLVGTPVAGERLTTTGVEEIVIRGVSPSVFAILGRTPTIGRVFGDRDGAASEAHVAVLSHSGWRRLFGADSSILGQSINVNGGTYSLIGVMPAGFEGDERVDAWIPLDQLNGSTQAKKEDQGYWVVAKLADAATVESADADLASRAAAWRESLGSGDHRSTAQVVSMRTFMRPAFVEQVRGAAYATSGALALVALLSLLLLGVARDSSRASSFAIQASLGAPRSRLVAAQVAEALLVGALAAAASAVASTFLYERLLSATGLQSAWWAAPSVSARALTVAGTLVLVMSLISATLSSVRATRINVLRVLQRASFARSSVDHQGERIVALQICLSVVMLSATGASALHVFRLATLDLGFDGGSLVQVRPPGNPTNDSSRAHWRYATDELDAYVRHVPGVQAVGATQFARATDQPVLAGRNETPSGQAYSAGVRDIVLAYANRGLFGAVPIVIVQGRPTTSDEDNAGAPVVLLSKGAAAALFPGLDPIGQTVAVTLNETRHVLTVIGVTKDVNLQPRQHVSSPYIAYSPALVNPNEPPLIIARGASGAAFLAKAIDEALRKRYGLVHGSAAPFGAAMASWVEVQSVPARVVAPLAAVTLFAALISVFALVSHSIRQRLRDLGIRAALGASPMQNAAQIVRSVTPPVGVGVILGIALSVAIVKPVVAFAHIGEFHIWIPLLAAMVFLITAAIAVARPISRAVRASATRLLAD
jgi:putative ABC transport system permease protein